MDGFEVEPTALDAAAARLAALVTAGAAADLPVGGSFGDAGLDGALAGFAGRWQTGVAALTTDLTNVSKAVTLSARRYGDVEQGVTRSFGARA